MEEVVSELADFYGLSKQATESRMSELGFHCVVQGVLCRQAFTDSRWDWDSLQVARLSGSTEDILTIKTKDIVTLLEGVWKIALKILQTLISSCG